MISFVPFFETVWRIMFNDFAGNFPVLVCCLRSRSLKKNRASHGVDTCWRNNSGQGAFTSPVCSYSTACELRTLLNGFIVL